jgi:hypothetical protein
MEANRIGMDAVALRRRVRSPSVASVPVHHAAVLVGLLILPLISPPSRTFVANWCASSGSALFLLSPSQPYAGAATVLVNELYAGVF